MDVCEACERWQRVTGAESPEEFRKLTVEVDRVLLEQLVSVTLRDYLARRVREQRGQ